eukprot:Hpha_TRINITY_DN20066_c0_g1::TRINITY_DN20066_c0_g1_i1::g.147854::m.147854/K12816/CDC40, PRP17; pre-mRNA-processing factor 17
MAGLPGLRRSLVDIAPDVPDEIDDRALQSRGCGEVFTNLKADELFAPVAGPAHPWRAPDRAQRNAFSGNIEDTHMSEYTFEQEFHRHRPRQFDDWSAKRHEPDPKRLRKEFEEAKAAKAAAEADAPPAPAAGGDGEGESDEEFDGSKPAGALTVVKEGGGEVATTTGAPPVPQDDRVEGHDMYFEEDRKGNRIRRVEAIHPEVVPHYNELHDYQGRSRILHCPLRPFMGQCSLPSRLAHTYRGHNKGVQVLRWMPPLGHLFASGGLDGKIKLWETFGKREVLQTYMGHFKGIKDIAFDLTGEHFLSCSYDNFIRVWETETGKVLHTFSNGSTPNVVKWHPSESRPNIFFAGCSDKQLHQYDVRSGRIVQSYDQHLGGINTCTFVDNNRRIVTTSDDKTMRVWEMDLPVPIKHVMDPSMHSMPAATIHPSQEWFAAQSMDNQMLVYSATDRFRLNRRKRFVGHVVAGYACEPGFSPDGRFVSSGNGDGELFIWSWGTTRIVKHWKCHKKVLLSHLWHPSEPSLVLTSSWDAEIKLWE